MTIYNVHIYREMRLFFDGIEADTPEAAAAIARDGLAEDADAIDECDGEDFAALVDMQGDTDFERSVTIDFAPERRRKAAPALLAALEELLAHLEDLGGEFSICDEIARSSYGKAAGAAIAEAKSAGIRPAQPIGDTPAPFEYTHDPDETPDRAFVLVDNLFDVAIIRTGEGIVIDVYPRHGMDIVATMAVWDEQVAATPEDDA